MNKYLASIKSVDNSIARLKELKRKGDYKAAGLSLTVRVGLNGEEVELGMVQNELDFSLGFTTDLEAVLDTFIKGLEASRKFWVRYANEDFQELKKFFEKEPPHA